MLALFPHQKQAAERIAQGTPTYLGFDMGIGKSRTFIEAVRLKGAKQVLILCPASAVLVWKREIVLWHPQASFVVVKTPQDLRAHATYYIVTHGLMSQAQGKVAEALAFRSFDMTAVDEAQAYNAPGSQRVQALKRAAPRLGHIVPLSGTPMKNHAGDLFNLVSLCYPYALVTSNGSIMNRYEYEQMFCQVASRNFNGHAVRVIEGSKNLPLLRRRLEPFMLRVRKEQVFKDLPPLLWDSIPIQLDPTRLSAEDITALARLDSDLIAADDGRPGLEAMAAALQRYGKSSHIMALRRLLGIAKLRAATEYIDDMLHNLPDDRKVLVFAHHADVIKALHTHLAEYLPALITGSSDPSERTEAVDQFLLNPSCRVFVGNIQAAGTAITLVGPNCKCSDVVFVESSWTPMDNAQAACRVHRIGQHDGVVVRMLSASGTVDDLINTLLVRKAREFTQLFDQKGKVQ